MRLARYLASAARASRRRQPPPPASLAASSVWSVPCRRCFSQGSPRGLPSDPPAPPVPRAPSLPATAPSGAIIFSGIQPTGVPHLGNYLGALLRWMQLQDEAVAASASATQLYYSVVDLHALTSVAAAPLPDGGAVLRRRRRETLAALLAVGLDPERCVLFYQSAVPAHSELMWLLSCTASVGYLSRMTQWKSKLDLKDDASLAQFAAADDKARAALRLGLFSYPVLMAADVLVHRATHVPVGEDQCQHLEFARECASGFNHAHGQRRLLVPPATLLSPARRVMSLQQPTQKMSKSHADARSRILLTDDTAAIRAKVMAARTDSTNAVSYDPTNRPGVANLLEILALVEGEGNSGGTVEATARALAAEMEGKTLGVLKARVADALAQRLEGIRERFVHVLERDGGAYLDRVAAHGAKRARANAKETMDAVRTAIGL